MLIWTALSRISTDRRAFYLIFRRPFKIASISQLISHEYGKIELEQVYEIAQNDINDLNEYVKAIFNKIGLAD
jgi:uncharacterized protein with HEPN domain